MAVLAPTMSAAIRTALRSIAFLVVAACASGPNLARALTIETGRRTTVQLFQFRDDRLFTLQNQSSGMPSEVYSDTRVDTMTKVVPDEMLQRLLDVFAEKGTFARASSSAPAEATSALVVKQGNHRFIFHRGAFSVSEAKPFHEAQAYFLSVYNQATAYHSSNIQRGDLRAENDRIQSASDAAKRKLEKLRRRRQ